MAENTIEIEVELKGQDKTLKGLDEIKDGAEGIGETFKGVGDIVGRTNEQLGESLSAVSDAVGSGVEAFQGMREAVSEVAAGTAGISALVGPISLLTVAVGGALEAYRQFSGAAKEAEDRQEALAAASSDLMAKLEQLAERGLVPATRELLSFSRANLTAQIQKELLEKQIERASKVILRERDAQEALNKAGRDAAKVFKDQASSYQEQRVATEQVKEAHASLVTAQQNTVRVFDSLGKSMAKTQEMLDGVEKKYKTLEEQTEENLKTKAKELITRRAAVELLKAEATAQDEVALLIAKDRAERSKQIQLNVVENLERAQLVALVNAHKTALKEMNEEAIKDAVLSRKIAELNKKKAESRVKDTSAAKAQAAALKAIQAERLALVQESQIRQLDIKLTKEGDAELLALARERYETGLELAKDDAMKRAIVEKQYQLETQNIMDQAEAREMARFKRQDEAQRKILEQAAARRKKALQEEIAEQKKLMDQVGGVIDMYGKGLAEAGVAALLFGEGFKKAAGEVLKGLAIESSVRALMEGAKALAALFINPAAAAAHGKSAGLYTAAAVAARAGAGALGVGGSGGVGGGGATASPSGAPQEATAPQRERAETRETVVNINFGGAVIYDSQEAARRAMMNELVRTYNSAPRGSARFNMGR